MAVLHIVILNTFSVRQFHPPMSNGLPRVASPNYRESECRSCDVYDYDKQYRESNTRTQLSTTLALNVVQSHTLRAMLTCVINVIPHLPLFESKDRVVMVVSN